MEFQEAYASLLKELGGSRKMVLSTSLRDAVTSRMMSVVILHGRFYFQTDAASRKYRQLKGNPRVSLCTENIQIEGHCREAGAPLEGREFASAYQKAFPSSYRRYSGLESERLFEVAPAFIQKWTYREGVPYIETFDVANGRYQASRYAAGGGRSSAGESE